MHVTWLYSRPFYSPFRYTLLRPGPHTGGRGRGLMRLLVRWGFDTSSSHPSLPSAILICSSTGQKRSRWSIKRLRNTEQLNAVMSTLRNPKRVSVKDEFLTYEPFYVQFAVSHITESHAKHNFWSFKYLGTVDDIHYVKKIAIEKVETCSSWNERPRKVTSDHRKPRSW